VSTHPPPPSFTLNGKIVLIGILTTSFLLGILSYIFVPHLITNYLVERPKQLEKTFQHLEESLLAYTTDNKSIPPLVSMELYRRKNKNFFKSKAQETQTFHLAVLTPYLKEHQLIADPFAMPEQFVPPAVLILEYQDEKEVYLYSPGPDLIYQLQSSPPDQGLSLKEQRESLMPIIYDATNGANSSGDIIHILKISLDL
jgi:hypothetical protein